jgi:hypothetical protein
MRALQMLMIAALMGPVALLAPVAVRADGTDTGVYAGAPVTLPPGGHNPLPLDANGNLVINCAVGCGTSDAPTSVTIVGPDGPEGGVSVSINPYRANANNQSGGVTVGGAWQQVFATNSLRTRMFVQNYSSPATQGIASTESLFVAVSPTMPTGTPMAVPGPVELLPGGSYDSSSAVVGTAPVWLWSATTGHHFVALEW